MECDLLTVAQWVVISINVLQLFGGCSQVAFVRGFLVSMLGGCGKSSSNCVCALGRKMGWLWHTGEPSLVALYQVCCTVQNRLGLFPV